MHVLLVLRVGANNTQLTKATRLLGACCLSSSCRSNTHFIDSAGCMTRELTLPTLMDFGRVGYASLAVCATVPRYEAANTFVVEKNIYACCSKCEFCNCKRELCNDNLTFASAKLGKQFCSGKILFAATYGGKKRRLAVQTLRFAFAVAKHAKNLRLQKRETALPLRKSLPSFASCKDKVVAARICSGGKNHYVGATKTLPLQASSL